ncbi:MAG: hypothetical protein L0H93_02510 [Nocardioides sp.]|nr:hypothetical protein [Nocardioides sp.]
MTCIITRPTRDGRCRIECDEHDSVPAEVFTDLQIAINVYEKHWSDLRALRVGVTTR